MQIGQQNSADKNMLTMLDFLAISKLIKSGVDQNLSIQQDYMNKMALLGLILVIY